ncbi:MULTISPECIES: GNAT family N-acetyltransferase [unclassified Pseudomonas]|uniref:GNAT family N-acetyltransferase n=1 Tax=unclassified Pseudomonas TaxID=196821 RepID=UPI000624AE17|nr:MULTISPECIES: GNAT family N-acetyltransferase [unclassified Pseudomonas]QWA31128.1 GNAT family N-acetyltransferase [Pseudomonas sp. RC3H12]CRI57102.1 GNAT family acetyltransferase [Pseudomonas sp. CCOS 191]
MSLETTRLLLRPWRDTDAADLYEFAKDQRVGPIAGWPQHTSVENSAEIIRTVFNHPEVYAVELRENRRAVGCVGILIGGDSNFEISAQEGEIAYWIGVPYWGQGLIPEAVREVMRHAFETLKLKALWCGYFANNSQSFVAQSKCGFRHHHTEENKYNPFLQDYRTEHISRITYEQWLEHTKEGTFRAG